MRLGRQLVVAGIAFSALAIVRPAMGVEGAPEAAPRHAPHQEARFGGDDVRVAVDDAGLAQVEHALTYRITGGPPKGFDLTGVESEAVVDPVAVVSLDGEPTSAAHVERKDDHALRVSFDAPAHRASGHAVLVVRVRYAVDLVQARELALDGAMWRMGWTAPVAPEGYDTARVIFDLPAAPTEPRPLAADGTAGDDGRVVTLRRGAQRDELEMTRAHVAKGEGALWMARVDPRAFPRVVDPALRPPPPAPPQAAQGRGASVWLVALLAGALFGGLVGAKAAMFARGCKARGVAAAGLIEGATPLVRAWLAGGAFAAGTALQAASFPVWGALAIVVAMLAATARTPRMSPAPRGPGQWLALSPGEAFAPERASDLLDVATLAGKLTLLCAAAGSVLLGLALGRLDPSWLWLAPLDALALLPLFATGSRAQLPPDRALSPRRRLASLHRALKRDGALRVAPWARVPLGAAAPDELRLLVLPRAAMPGVVGIEVGIAWVATPAGYAAETEVLVRVHEASAAAARLVTLAPRRPPVHGRKTGERVVRLVPSLPSRAGALALVRRLARELHDRRKSLPSVTWPGAERRLPPNERLRKDVPVAA